MKRFLVAVLFAFSVGIALPGIAQADPDLPEPPRPGELPHVDDDHPWWDPLGLFDDDDDDKKHHDDRDDRRWWDPLGFFDDDDDEHRGRGHDKHEGKKQKHREKHDD